MSKPQVARGYEPWESGRPLSAEEVREAFRSYVRDGMHYGKDAQRIARELGGICTQSDVITWMHRDCPRYVRFLTGGGKEQSPDHMGKEQWNRVQVEQIKDAATRKAMKAVVGKGK